MAKEQTLLTLDYDDGLYKPSVGMDMAVLAEVRWFMRDLMERRKPVAQLLVNVAFARNCYRTNAEYKAQYDRTK